MLENLYRIQQMDLELDRLRNDELRIPGDLSQARDEKAQLSEAFAQYRQNKERTAKEIDRSELDLADFQGKLKKSREEQQKNAFDAKVQTQYENVIQQLDDRVREIEDTLAPLYEQREVLEAHFKALQDSEKKLKPRLEKLEAMDGDRISALRAEHTQKTTERNALAESIEKRQFKEYEMIRKNRKGLGLVALQNSCCSGCNMKLPINIQQQAKTMKLPAAKCPSCGRILVVL